MSNLSKQISTLALLAALPFLLSLPAHAQDVTETTTTTTTVPANSEVVEQHIQRQQYREEMQRVRSEHEKLDSEHDALKTQCMNAKGQEHIDCNRKWSEWRVKRDTLHQRMQALHQQEAANGEQGWASRRTVAKHSTPGGNEPAPVVIQGQ